MSPDRPVTPELRRLFVRQMGVVAALVVVAIVAITVVGWIAYRGRVSAEDSFTATRAQFATQVRGQCLQDRRTAESAAQGAQQDAIIGALIALKNDDDAEFARQVADGQRATEARKRAAHNLDPDVIVQPPPVGCGPPVTSTSTLDDAEEH
jgi:hypothetical protein